MTAARLLLLSLVLTLAGCEKIETLLADPRVAQRIADSKAIGSACRYGIRSIEDCYAKNEKASKAAIFEGWKEMDQYMRENNINGVTSNDDKPTQPMEEVVDEKASDGAGKDKPKPKAKPPADKASS